MEYPNGDAGREARDTFFDDETTDLPCGSYEAAIQSDNITAPADFESLSHAAAEDANYIFTELTANTSPPTRAECNDITSKYGAIKWLGGYRGHSPIFATFGAPNPQIHFNGIDSQAPLAVVKLQLQNFTDTLIAVDEAAEATGTITALAKTYQDRILVERSNETDDSGVTTFSVGQYDVSLDTENHAIQLAERTQQANSYMRHDLPDGTIILIPPQATNRHVIKKDGDTLWVTYERLLALHLTDADYFDGLHQRLVHYRNTLLEVAEHAGVTRDDLFDENTRTWNIGVLLGEVGPKVKDEFFQATLPEDLVTYMDAIARSIDRTLRPSGRIGNPDSMQAIGIRVAEYFREFLTQKPARY